MKADEKETCANLNAADRIAGGSWTFYSDDAVMVAKLRKVALSSKRVGAGWQFELAQESVSFRRVLSDQDKAQRVKRLQSKSTLDQGAN